jgi:hypothetical protein
MAYRLVADYPNSNEYSNKNAFYDLVKTHRDSRDFLKVSLRRRKPIRDLQGSSAGVVGRPDGSRRLGLGLKLIEQLGGGTG